MSITPLLDEFQSDCSAWLARDREASRFSNLDIHFGFMRLNPFKLEESALTDSLSTQFHETSLGPPPQDFRLRFSMRFFAAIY